MTPAFVFAAALAATPISTVSALVMEAAIGGAARGLQLLLQCGPVEAGEHVAGRGNPPASVPTAPPAQRGMTIMAGYAGELACRLTREAEAVCRHYLSNGRREGRYWLVGDVNNTPGRSMFVRLSNRLTVPR